VHPPREVALGQAIGWILALAGGAAAFSWAFLLFFADREQRAIVFVLGGLALVIWAAVHLTDGRHESR
jgi:Na+-transporting NADH:ubiquinone oxidoreductase subunit NqrF